MVILFLVVLLQFVSAVPTIAPSNGTSYSVPEANISFYNISITNDISYFENITQVNITLPSGFVFVVGSDGTNSSGVFSNSGNNLIWSSSSYVINGTDMKYFWFSANSSTVSNGTYELIVDVTNSTFIYSKNISIKVVEAACVPDWHCKNISACINGTKTQDCYDWNGCENDSTIPDLTWGCTLNCVSNWTCTNWSDCLNDLQIRSCVDLNICGDDSDKPAENQTCGSGCVPDWDCTEWPEDGCSKGEYITIDCADLNNCGGIEGMPPTSKLCNYVENFGWMFWVIVSMVLLMIAFVISLIIVEVKKINSNLPRKPL